VHLTVVSREAALVQAPRLAQCLDSLKCQLELATQNFIPQVLTLRADVREGPAPDWRFRVEVLDTAVGAAAAATTQDCKACSSERAAADLAAVMEQTLKTGLLRLRGKLELTSDPPGAEVVVQGRPDRVIGVTPLRAAAWAGPLELAIRHPGYKTYRETLTVAESQTAKRSFALTKGEDPAVPAPSVARTEILPRPRWRLAVGGSALGLGIGIMGLGISALSVNDQCVDDPSNACMMAYATVPVGTGLLVGGALLAAGGITLLALPGRKRSVVVSVAEPGLRARLLF
jgi:hypothetical protein